MRETIIPPRKECTCDICQGITPLAPVTVTLEQPLHTLPKDKDNTSLLDKLTSAQRKTFPIARGLLDYFPDACAAIGHVSFIGNEQHNKGEPMHWARGKSTDHADCIVRHLTQRGTIDSDGIPHSWKLAWRALALVQLEIESGLVPEFKKP